MNEENREYVFDDRHSDTYRTGSTQPPHRKSGCFAVLLVLVILLGGIVSILGAVNVRLLRKLNTDTMANTVPIAFSAPVETSANVDATVSTVTPKDPVVQIDPVAENTGALSLQDVYEAEAQQVPVREAPLMAAAPPVPVWC